MKRTILAVLFIMISFTGANAYSCGNTKVVIDHPGYREALRRVGALYDLDRNTIALSTGFMSRYSKNVQRFIFAHECGHYHLQGGSEFDADSYAIRVFKKNGGTLSPDDLKSICGDVGPERCSNIKNELK